MEAEILLPVTVKAGEPGKVCRGLIDVSVQGVNIKSNNSSLEPGLCRYIYLSSKMTI